MCVRGDNLRAINISGVKSSVELGLGLEALHFRVLYQN